MNFEKTPVTILQEMMTKMGCSPNYELCPVEMDSNPQIFKYKVTCDDMIATGSGRSKRDAKHSAAASMLQLMNRKFSVKKSNGLNKPSTTKMVYPNQEVLGAMNKVFNSCNSKVINATTARMLQPSVLSESSENINQSNLNNSIQELQNLCFEYQLEGPIYNDAVLVGPAHAQSYTVQCAVSKITVCGIGRTKKQAKFDAAKKMKREILDIFGVGAGSSNRNECKKSETKNESVKLQIKYNLNLQSQRSELVRHLTHLIDAPLLKLENLSRLVKKCQQENSTENNAKAKQEFQKLLEAAQIDFHHMLLQTVDPVTFMLIIQLNTTPDILEMSLGTTREEAELRTINKVIDTLKSFFI